MAKGAGKRREGAPEVARKNGQAVDYDSAGMVWFDHGVSPQRIPADQGSTVIRREPRSATN